ncbi:MAG: helix-turn-helix transcriptional regulator [Bacilli bacterium]|nr:helix-turn-helix transcriptional regulator [Bacilli bacterium]
MNNVKMYRGLAGLSQKELAERVGITRQGLVFIENGRSWLINRKILTKICEELNVSKPRILGLENFKYIPETKEDADYMISLMEKLKETL